MSLRRWIKEHVLRAGSKGDDLPPASALANTALGRDPERGRSLGEYDAVSYPSDLRTLLTRREDVMRELLSLNVTTREGRVEAIPRVRELLGKYPLPLAYETLIHAYLDAGLYDEAKGAVFAARQRRSECERSEHPEIRSEVEGLREWTPDDIDEIRLTREG